MTDPQGSLARAGFRDGDLVVASDGQAFQGEKGVMRLMRLELEGSVTCQERGGERGEVRLQASAMGGAPGSVERCVR